jgi:hypothetical protein
VACVAFQKSLMNFLPLFNLYLKKKMNNPHI